MATVIDALVVEFGLDPSKFTSGQKKAIQSVERLEKKVDKSGKNMERTINSVRNQVLSLMAAFLAGRGIKEFIHDMAVAEAEAARLAKTLDTIPQELSAWGGAATMTGGSMAGLSGSVQGLVSQFQQFSLTGESSVIPWFRALQVNITDLDTGKMRDFGSILLDLADRFQGMDPARAAAFGRALGLDQGTINLLIQGRKAVEAMLAEQRRLGVMTKEDAEAGLALQHSWLALQQSSQSLGRTLLTEFAPVLGKILDALTNVAVWMRGHKAFLEAFFIGLAVAATIFTIALSPITFTIALVTAAVVALVGILALLFDDWDTWMKGGTSSFGWFFDSVSTYLKLLVKNFSDSFKLIKDIITGNWKDVKLDWEAIKKDVSNDVAGTTHFVKKAISPDGKGGGVGVYGGPPGTPEAAAAAAEKKYGIPAAITLAQYKLESGNGKHMPAGSNNPFGIKAKAGEPYVEATTREFVHGQMVQVKQRFRKFDSLAQAFDEHAKLLATSPAYKKARAAGANTSAFADALTGVYATDPNYGAKLKNIIASNKGSTSTSTTSHQTKIDKVIVQTNERDAPGIARDIKPAIERDAFASQAQYAAA